jgi:hypothetical protein
MGAGGQRRVRSAWTYHSGRMVRSSSVWGSRSTLTSTLRASSISSGVRWRMKTGFPRHLTMRFLPVVLVVREQEQANQRRVEIRSDPDHSSVSLVRFASTHPGG